MLLDYKIQKSNTERVKSHFNFNTAKNTVDTVTKRKEFG
jgi:hypothetical protein